MQEEKFSLAKRLKSFIYAFNGLRLLLVKEHNARIHLLATAMAILAGFVWRISPLEWAMIIFCIGFVWAMELVNTAIEALADHVTSGKNPAIKKTKDLAAAAVLVSAAVACTVGMLIFLPKIF